MRSGPALIRVYISPAWPTVPQCSGNTFLALSQIYSDLSRYKALILWQQQQMRSDDDSGDFVTFSRSGQQECGYCYGQKPRRENPPKFPSSPPIVFAFVISLSRWQFGSLWPRTIEMHCTKAARRERAKKESSAG